MKYLSLALILAFGGPNGTPITASAQSGGRTVAMRAVFNDGVVKIRWAMESPVVWNLLRRDGVTLLRQEASEPKPVVISGAPLRVRGVDWWEGEARTNPAAAQVGTLLRENPVETARLSEYAKADLDQNRLTALLLIAEFRFDIAVGLALGYRDADVKRNSIYRYTLLIPDTLMHDTIRAECFVSTEQEDVLVPVQGLHAQPGDGFVDLSWERSLRHSGYFVERAEARSTQWMRLNKAPKIYADNFAGAYLYRDSVPNGPTYHYRVIGTDAFGRESPPLAEVEAAAADKTPPQPPHDLRWKKHGAAIRLTWQNPPSEPDLAGYVVLRSRRPDIEYTPVHRELLLPGTTTRDDTVPAGTYFYRLVASDSSGNLSPMSARVMAVIDDTLPPPAPAGLVAVADTTGVITLRWRQRLEDDVAGYRVYRQIATGASPEFIPLNSSVIVDTVWKDTLQADLGDRFVYRVRAVDFAGNCSAPCESASARFPDRTAPAPPAILECAAKDRLVRLTFASPSRDVARYEIHRTPPRSREMELDATVSAGEWTDSTAEHGGEYRYAVIAVDSSGNRSQPSTSAYVHPFWHQEILPPDAPAVTWDPKTRAVTISWSFPDHSGCGAIVYRAVNSGAFIPLSPKTTETRFVDGNLRSGEYRYALRFFTSDAGGSTMGAAAKITTD